VHLTKPLDIAPADESASEIEERLIDVVASLVAYLKTPEAVYPRQRPLHYPPVPTQLLAGLDAPASDTRGYTSLLERLAASRKVVALVGVQLLWALTRSATALSDRRDGVHGLLQYIGVLDVGRRVDHRERDPLPVDHNMALRARFTLPSGSLRSFGPRGLVRLPSPKKPSPSRSRPLLPGSIALTR
jgi:hypothetical protein